MLMEVQKCLKYRLLLSEFEIESLKKKSSLSLMSGELSILLCRWNQSSWGHSAPPRMGFRSRSVAYWVCYSDLCILQYIIFSASQGHIGLPGLRGQIGQQGPPVSVSKSEVSLLVVGIPLPFVFSDVICLFDVFFPKGEPGELGEQGVKGERGSKVSRETVKKKKVHLNGMCFSCSFAVLGGKNVGVWYIKLLLRVKHDFWWIFLKIT